jgi:hypothetical protein
MKRLILIISAIFFVITLSAQDHNQSLGKNASNVTFSGTAADTITNTDTWSYQWNLAAKDVRMGYNLFVKLDSVSGTPTDACILKGSQDASSWVNIDTVNWAGTSADTSFYFNDVSTGVLYRYLKLDITGTGTQKAKVNKIFGKIGGL